MTTDQKQRMCDLIEAIKKIINSDRGNEEVMGELKKLFTITENYVFAWQEYNNIVGFNDIVF